MYDNMCKCVYISICVRVCVFQCLLQVGCLKCFSVCNVCVCESMCVCCLLSVYAERESVNTYAYVCVCV